MKATGDDDGAGSQHGDCDGIEELLVAEPAVFLHDAAVEERHDRQTAAEHERPGLGEEPRDLREELGRDRHRQARGRRSFEPGRRRQGDHRH
jgi:hypothetical protein